MAKLVSGAETLTTLLTKLLIVLITLLALATVLILVGRLVRLRLQRQLVVADLVNASGSDDIDDRLVGLSQLAREELVTQISRVEQKINASIAETRLPNYSPDLDPQPLPSSTPDEGVTKLATSLTTFVGGQAGPAVTLINDVLLRPNGTKVAMTLQRQGDAPGQLGITFEIADLAGEEVPRPFTLWEPAGARRSNSAAESDASTRASKQAGDPAQGDGRAPQPDPAPHLAIGIGLTEVGLLADAVTYLEQGLRANSGSAELAQALALAVKRLRRQSGATAAFALGKKLEQAGLLDQAIDCYVHLLPRSQQAARQRWEVALGDGDGSAAAYHELATIYAELVHLTDESRELYRIAAGKGWRSAADTLAKSGKAAAQRLTEVGRRLHELASYSAAERYITMALDFSPNDPDASAMLAEVKQRQRPDDNAVALAHLQLGRQYANVGALEEAKAEYIDAIKAQPGNTAAQDALAAVLLQQRSIEARYVALLRPAARWLALELAERELSRGLTWPVGLVPTKPHDRRRDQALVANYFGLLFQASARTYPGHEFDFYDGAIKRFAQALELAPRLLPATANLADSYSRKGQLLGGEEGIELLRWALIEYDRALALLKTPDQVVGQAKREAKRLTVLMLTINRASTALLTGEVKLQEGAANEIMGLGASGWRAASEREALLLYNLASCYGLALAARRMPGWLRRYARLLLAYSLGRDADREYWTSADTDPDLERVASLQDLRTLRFELERTLEKHPTLPMMDHDPFEAAMREVLDRARWLDRGGTMSSESFKIAIDGIQSAKQRALPALNEFVKVRESLDLSAMTESEGKQVQAELAPFVEAAAAAEREGPIGTY